MHQFPPQGESFRQEGKGVYHHLPLPPRGVLASPAIQVTQVTRVSQVDREKKG